MVVHFLDSERQDYSEKDGLPWGWANVPVIVLIYFKVTLYSGENLVYLIFTSYNITVLIVYLFAYTQFRVYTHRT